MVRPDAVSCRCETGVGVAGVGEFSKIERASNFGCLYTENKRFSRVFERLDCSPRKLAGNFSTMEVAQVRFVFLWRSRQV